MGRASSYSRLKPFLHFDVGVKF